MFCTKCGSNIEGESQFCSNCGAPRVEQKDTPSNNNDTAPQPFQQYSNLTNEQPVYKKTAFKGKQFTTCSSGHVSFGNSTKKKGKGCGIVAGVLIGIVVLLIILVLVFGGSNDAYDVKMASAVDSATNLPVTATNTFKTNTPLIFCTFKSDAEAGTIVNVEWWYTTNDAFITDASLEIPEKGIPLSFSLSIPIEGWPVGDYEAKIYVDENYVTSKKFKVE